MTFRVLLVGLGQIGMGYDYHLPASRYVYTHARAFGEHPGFALAAGVDPDPARAAAFRERYHASAHVDLAAALADTMPEVVVISTPTAMHGQVLDQVLAAGSPRAILCEKPLATDLATGRRMVARCRERGVSLFVNYMRRADPAVIEVKRRIDAGEIPGPLKGVAWYSKGFFHNGSHLFDLLQYWLGSAEEALVLDAGRRWAGHDPEPDVRVGFPKGPVIFLSAREEAYSHYEVELVSPSGRLRYEQGGERVVWQGTRDDPQFPGYTILNPVPELIGSGMDRYQWHVVEQLASALDGRTPYLSSGAEALATLEVMHRILEVP